MTPNIGAGAGAVVPKMLVVVDEAMPPKGEGAETAGAPNAGAAGFAPKGLFAAGAADRYRYGTYHL